MSEDDYSGVRASYGRDQSTDGAVGAGGAGGGGGGGKHRNPRFSWNPQFEATFFRSLCESVQLGLREGSTFKQEAWDRAEAALRDRHHAYANKGHLINKSDNARKKFRLWRGLREDPEFVYNPNTHMVTASEEAWRRHVQKEPLSRSLKGRPFEHEEFYEILFPDVIGSGGAPKRVTKPRRKGPDDLDGTEEQETPDTAVMDVIAEPAYVAPPARMPSTTAIPPPIPPTARPTSTALPPRTSIASTSALTPPEENAPHTRKRFAGPPAVSAPSAGGPSQSSLYKRRRMTNMSATSTTDAAAPGSSTGVNPSLTNGFVDLTSNNPAGSTATPPITLIPGGPSSSSVAPGTTGPSGGSAAGSHDALLALAEALRAAGRGAGAPRWQEQAMEIFFRDFGDEDMDLQLKIAEKALTDENKALVFCKMPVALRRHWIKRLREVHNRGMN